MKVKDQIKARREQLGMNVSELGRRIGVSAQAIRFWESGRSYPTRKLIPGLEAALSFTLDLSEGSQPDAHAAQVTALIDPKDIDLLLLICRLPGPFKELMANLAKAHLSAILGEQRKSFRVAEVEKPVKQFNERRGTKVAGKKEAAKKRASPREAKAA